MALRQVHPRVIGVRQVADGAVGSQVASVGLSGLGVWLSTGQLVPLLDADDPEVGHRGLVLQQHPLLVWGLGNLRVVVMCSLLRKMRIVSFASVSVSVRARVRRSRSLCSRWVPTVVSAP